MGSLGARAVNVIAGLGVVLVAVVPAAWSQGVSCGTPPANACAPKQNANRVGAGVPQSMQQIEVFNPFGPATSGEVARAGSLGILGVGMRGGYMPQVIAPATDGGPQDAGPAGLKLDTDHTCAERAQLGVGSLTQWRGLVSLDLTSSRPGPDEVRSQWCSATIVTRRAFLTAAHCVDPVWFGEPSLRAAPMPATGRRAGFRCVSPGEYGNVEASVRRARCNRGVPGCDMDLAVCTYDQDVFHENAVVPVAFEKAVPSDKGPTSRVNRVSACVLERARGEHRVTLAGYGDNGGRGAQLCRAHVRLCAMADEGRTPGAPLTPTAAYGIAFDHNGSFGASGDSGGAVLWPAGQEGKLVGVITQFNFEARATYFVDLTRPAVARFLLGQLCRDGAARNPNCPGPGAAGP